MKIRKQIPNRNGRPPWAIREARYVCACNCCHGTIAIGEEHEYNPSVGNTHILCPINQLRKIGFTDKDLFEPENPVKV